MESVRLALATAAIVGAAATGAVTATPPALQGAGFAGTDIALASWSIEPAGAAATWDLPDPFGVMQEVFTHAQRQMSDGIEYLAAGDLGIGVGLMTAGLANSFIYAPIASFLTVVDGILEQPLSWLALPDSYFLGFSDFAGLMDQVDGLVTSAFDRLTLAFEEFAAGQISYGLSGLFYSFTNFLPDIPLQLVVGSAILIEDMLGL
ncbi:hypothetical protein [Mycolicibacter minnesotensis]